MEPCQKRKGALVRRRGGGGRCLCHKHTFCRCPSKLEDAFNERYLIKGRETWLLLRTKEGKKTADVAKLCHLTCADPYKSEMTECLGRSCHIICLQLFYYTGKQPCGGNHQRLKISDVRIYSSTTNTLDAFSITQFNKIKQQPHGGKFQQHIKTLHKLQTLKNIIPERSYKTVHHNIFAIHYNIYSNEA